MSTEKKWVVKSSDSITGPFEFDQVVQNIFSGDVHLLDEIKGPFERWRPIKDHSLFAAAIEKLKASTYSNREATMTATVDLGTQTHSITETTTQSKNNSVGSQSDGDEAEMGGRSYQQRRDPGSDSIGQRQARRSQTSTVFMFSFLLLIIGGASYLVYEFKQSKLKEQKTSAYDQLTDQAIAYLGVGEYQKALKNFKMAYNISSADPNLIVEMAPLSVQFDGQFSQTHMMIEKLLATHYKKDYMKRGKNTVGLTQSYRGRYKEALESFNEAIAMDKSFLPPQLNKAFALIKLGRPDEAATLMREVVREFPNEAFAHYLYIRSLVELGLKGKDQHLKEALSVADHFEQNFTDLKQEVLFLVALAKMKLGAKGDEFQQLIQGFLKVDFDATNLHVHDTSIDFQSFNWIDYVDHCATMRKGLDEYHSSLLQGFCMLKINRTIEAKKIFETLLSQQNDDGVLQALYASSLLSSNQLSQAKNALGFINQIDEKQPVVETILRGCLIAEDLSCGDAIFRGRHANHISLLYSHWGKQRHSSKGGSQ